jgi:hypothetical protein
MTTPPEHDQLLAAGYTVATRPGHIGHRVDYMRGAVWLTYIVPPPTAIPRPGHWHASVDGPARDWRARGCRTPEDALAVVRGHITADAADLLALAATATLEPLP